METGTPPVTFPSQLGNIHGIAARFIGRLPEIDTLCERTEAMKRLRAPHLAILSSEGLGEFPLVTAEQIHGNGVARVVRDHSTPIRGVDGLMTMQRGLTLGIHVADCAAVWIVARDGSAGGLFHSGKKGTDLGITREGIRTLIRQTGKSADDFLAVIGPCIRPPCYEVDFAAEIARQALDEGITEIHDAGICTACHPDHYYSYRRERGLTGRMLATLTLLP
jgi:polyphenol oxidase